MAKTQEEFQQELAQLFVRAGETQFMVRAFKKGIEDENNKLNNLNQKIENLQKSYRTHLAQSAQQAPEAPVVAEVSDAVAPAENIPA